MGIFLYGSGTVNPDLAQKTLSDWLAGGSDCEAIITDGCEWIEPVAAALGLALVPFTPDFTSADTVITPANAEGVEDILRSGAVVLDVSDGMVPLELIEEPEVVDAPDIPEELVPEPVEQPVLEEPPAAVAEPKPKKSRKKPSLPKSRTKTEKPAPEPVDEPAPEAPTLIVVENNDEADAPDEPIPFSPRHPAVKGQSPAFYLRGLVNALLEDTNEDTLWTVLEVLRSRVETRSE